MTSNEHSRGYVWLCAFLATGLMWLGLNQQAYASPKLYVFDCGVIYLDDIEMFNLNPEETNVRELFVPCYLIEHEQGMLVWDGGLPLAFADTYAKTGERIAQEGGSVVYERSFITQLADMGLSPADITYTAFSHLHWDHAGAANAFVHSKILMQQAEWVSLKAGDSALVSSELINAVPRENLVLLEGDHDVFGDGSVRIIYAPGHTPGHQTLLVKLANYGPVLLSGDLYHFEASRALRRAPHFNFDAQLTHASMDKIEGVLGEHEATLWIEHNKALADSLAKAPEFYD